jgi:aconitate hydratase
MGVLPLQFQPGEDATTLGLSGRELFEIDGISRELAPHTSLEVSAVGESGTKRFKVLVRIDTPNELDYFRHGGILPFVLRQLAKAG